MRLRRSGVTVDGGCADRSEQEKISKPGLTASQGDQRVLRTFEVEFAGNLLQFQNSGKARRKMLNVSAVKSLA